MGAADYHVDITSCQRRKILVEIEIVAGHKAESNALDLDNVGLSEFVAVADVDLVAALLFGLYLAGSGMRLIIFACERAVTVKRVGGVAINEAVELAKKFGGDDAPAFVNGILAKLV